MEHRQKSRTLSSGVVQYMMLMYSDSFFRIVYRELTRRNLSPCLKKNKITGNLILEQIASVTFDDGCLIL